MSLHAIVGAGPVGTGTALELVAAGHQVRVITRSGHGPDHERIELVACDATDADRLTELTAGAHSLYNCANPPYDKWTTAWPPLAAALLTTAERTGARLVTMSNLYGYAADSSPMKSTDPLSPPTRKGAVRVEMWRNALAAHEAGRVRATELRASDYFGPGLGDSAHLGDRVVPRALSGKSVRVMGDPDAPHSWTYIGDVCRMLATLGTDDRALGRAWHVPTLAPRSAREMVAALCIEADVDPVAVRPVRPLALRAAGIFVPVMRELLEMRYQFDAPFIIDATDAEQTFAVEATPLDQQLAATVASYQQGVIVPGPATAPSPSN